MLNSAYHQALFVSDTINHRIVLLDTDGNLLSTFGESGTGDGQFNKPFGVTTDASGKIYVVDSDNHRVQMFDADQVFIRSFGHHLEEDQDDYELLFPKDIEVLSNGDIVVASQNSPAIRIFNQQGEFVRVWGTNGTADNEFEGPQYLVKTPSDTIFVTDWAQKKIQNFDATGNLIKIYAGGRTADGHFAYPYSTAVDSDGNIYVLDNTGRVQTFNYQGVYIDTIVEAGIVGGSAFHLAVSADEYLAVSADTHVTIFDIEGNYINQLGNAGVNGSNSGAGDFHQARGMVFDNAGYIYVADMVNNRIQKFDLTHVADADFNTTYSGGYVSQWAAPANVAHLFLHNNTDLYVAGGEPQDEDHNYIQVYNTSGVFQRTFLDSRGGGFGEYWNIGGIFIDEEDNFYLTDRYFNRVSIFDLSGACLDSFGGSGSGYEQFDEPSSIVVHPDTGDLLVIDHRNHRMHMMSDGVKIINLIDSAEVLDADNSLSLTRRSLDPTEPSVSSIDAELYFGDYVISDFNVNLSEERDWVLVNAIALPDESKALVVNLDPDNAPGISENHAVYVVKQSNQQSVRVCTEASSIADLTEECTGYTLEEGDAQLTSVEIGGIDYWRVADLTGTGVLGLPGEETEAEGDDDEVVTDNNIASASPSSSSSRSSSNACNGPAPSSASDLFQIDVTTNTAKLFFTPIGNTSDFWISFSTNPDAEMHGELVSLLREGVQSHKVYFLKPNTTYYFKVRGQLGCRPGEWSNIMSATTRRTGITGFLPYYKNFLSKKVASILPLTKTVAKPVTPSAIAPSAPASESSAKSAPVVRQETQTSGDTKVEKKQFCLWRWCW